MITLPANAVDAIARVMEEASPDEQALGADWYPQAHALAVALADGLPASHPAHADVLVSSAVLARYSVQTSWPQNVRLARMAYAAAEDPANALAGILATPTLGATRRAVARLLVAGEHPSQVITSQKVSDFLACIYRPDRDDVAVIDRHALAITIGRPLTRDEQGMSKTLYRATRDAYLSAAAMIGLPAPVVQAVTWVAWRNRYAVANHGHHA
jgi:hypothetical protein